MRTNNTREGRITAHRARSLTFSPPSLFRTASAFSRQRKAARFRPAFFTILIICLTLSPAIFGIRFTYTDSLPIGLYRSVPGIPTRGALVSICLPDDLSSLAKERGYGRPGRCPGDIAPLLKQVVAMPGDAVSVTDAGLTVNGIEISNTSRIHHDSQGRAIQMIDTGIYQTGNNELWLIANHSTRSWDSRYFGPIPMDQVQSAMQPLITWEDS